MAVFDSAPAVAELLKCKPIYAGDIECEFVTPTALGSHQCCLPKLWTGTAKKIKRPVMAPALVITTGFRTRCGLL